MLVFSSSLAPKLAATFNSRTTAPLAPSPLRTTSNSSSSLPTPGFLHLKASSGVKALQTTSPFKCYAAVADGKPLTILVHGEPKEIILEGGRISRSWNTTSKCKHWASSRWMKRTKRVSMRRARSNSFAWWKQNDRWLLERITGCGSKGRWTRWTRCSRPLSLLASLLSQKN